jgi:hypothetical protein
MWSVTKSVTKFPIGNSYEKEHLRIYSDVSNNGIVTIPPGLFEVENKKLALETL